MRRTAALANRIREVNQVRQPEHSKPLRAAVGVTVLLALAAPPLEGETGWTMAVGCMALVTAGMLFSYRTRVRPPGAVKILVAVGAIVVLVWFVGRIGGGPLSDISAVEDPLTELLSWILVLHSLHVPARKDLVFALAGSAALVAVAAAQALDTRFGVLAGAWILSAIAAGRELWSAETGVRSWTGGAGPAVAVLGVAAAAFAVLPPPHVALRSGFPARGGLGGGSVASPGALAGDSGSPAELSHPGRPSARPRVGGYLGFAGSLDTALRAHLGHQVVMDVRADFPDYFVGETFDRWTGQSWNSTLRPPRRLTGGSPFSIPGPTGVGRDDLQTFFLRNATADLVFHAGQAEQVWFPASSLFYGGDGSLVSPVGLGPGAVYTVDSIVQRPSAAQLEASEAPAGEGLSELTLSHYLALPHPYPRASALAEEVTAGASGEYARVLSLIAWISSNTRYSTDIPPVPSGQDPVDWFLFGNRTGYCEQISTSLAVMLRSIGIPAREAVGYVPGSYDPLANYWVVRAEDAHAWVQVWFPAYGWVDFDPTATVPLAAPSPGHVALTAIGRLAREVAWPETAGLVVAVGALAGAERWRRGRPATPALRAARRMERAGRRAGRRRRISETLLEYGSALDRLGIKGSEPWAEVAARIEEDAYRPLPETRLRPDCEAAGATGSRE